MRKNYAGIKKICVCVIINFGPPKVTQDTSLQAYIRLLTAAAPSDSVFRALGTN